MIPYLLVLSCIISTSAGQILFKVAAISLQRTGSYFDPNTAVILLSACAINTVTTVVWVWTLQHFELGRVYPLAALVFVFVPLGCYLILGERFYPQYFIGLVLIMAGIAISFKP